jgi:hypothetical protein
MEKQLSCLFLDATWFVFSLSVPLSSRHALIPFSYLSAYLTRTFTRPVFCSLARAIIITQITGYSCFATTSFPPTCDRR